MAFSENCCRFTKDIDFVVSEEWVEAVDRIMLDLGYEKQDFSTPEIASYISPLKLLQRGALG